MTDLPPPDAPVCFIDTETTSLVRPWTPHGRRVWEFAGIRYDPAAPDVQRLHIIIADVSMRDYSQQALDMNGWYERHPNGGGRVPVGALYRSEAEAAALIADFTRGTWLCASNWHFDEDNLFEMLVRHRIIDPRVEATCPWDYHEFDIESYVAGNLWLRPPWNTRTLADAVGVPRDATGAAHSAMPDADWCFLVYRHIHDSERSSLTALMDVLR